MSNKINQEEILKNDGGKTAYELYEQAQRKAGTEAIEMVADAQVDQIIALRERYRVDDVDLLGTNIVNVKDIPKQIRQDVANFHEKIRTIIEEVARRIEDHRYKSTDDEVKNMKGLSVNERVRITELINADKQLHISYESLKDSVGLLSDMNDAILRKLDESELAGDEVKERSLVLANAVLIYELTDYVIRYVQSFQLHGAAAIAEVQRSELNKLNQQLDTLSELRKRAEDEKIVEFKNSMLATIKAQESSLSLIKTEWESYSGLVQGIQSEVGVISTKIKSLQLLQDVAKSQITVLQAAAAVGMLKKNILALENAIQGLEKLKLVSLTPDRVKRLFNLGQSSDTRSLNQPKQ